MVGASAFNAVGEAHNSTRVHRAAFLSEGSAVTGLPMIVSDPERSIRADTAPLLASSCPERPEMTAAVAAFLDRQTANILSAHQ